jgi:hypothetical protein
MPKLRIWHKVSFAFSAELQGILSVIVLYVNPTSLMENARRTQKERLCCQVVNTVPTVLQDDLSKTELMNGTKETQHQIGLKDFGIIYFVINDV